MRQNYIEINFEQDVDINDDDFAILKEEKIPVNPHLHTMEEINIALHTMYPSKKMEIDWRDSRTCWVWPNGLMEQFTFTEEEKKRHLLQRMKQRKEK